MNTAALKQVFQDLGWGLVTEANYPSKIDWARAELAVNPDHEIARRIVEAADSDRAPVPTSSVLPLPSPPPPEPPAVPDDQIILGTDASGQPVTLEDFSRDGVGVWDQIMELTGLGARAKAAFSETRLSPLRRRAADLGVDAAAVEAWALANRLDPAEALRGEIALAATVARDRITAGLDPSPPRPPVYTRPIAPHVSIGDSALIQRAEALKIDVKAVEAAACAAGQDPAEVLKAEIEMLEIVARKKRAEGR